MKILAVEFSAPQRSVAVVQTGADGTPQTVSEVVETGPGWIRALELVDEALGQTRLEREQIECLAVGLGPGSYTGIRAAIALAQGWQLARGVKLVGVGSVDCLAARVESEGLTGRVNIVIDAQRHGFYLARWEIEEGGRREVEPLRLATFAEIQKRERAGELLAGPEVTRWFPAGRVVFPRAATLGKLAAGRAIFVSAEELEPIYLRATTFIKAPLPRSMPI
jgi:tRNA threonylcarbamoyl adenosine modification protein YeaZ